MATNVLIIGGSGTGKSTAIKTLNPLTTFLINVNGKDLPFKGWKSRYTQADSKNPNGNMVNCDKADKILSTIKHIDENRKEVNVGIIDDAQYILANEFMRRAKEKGYEKFTEIAEHYWSIIWACQLCRPDLIWFFLSHNETNEYGESKVKTIGKLLDDKICIEGMFSIVLSTLVDEGKYYFETKNNGRNTTKSPDEMFTENRISNNLEFVRNAILNYEKGE